MRERAALADESCDEGAEAVGRRLLANTALHLMAVGGMPEREAWAAAEKAMDSPDPFGMPTSDDLGDPSWEPEPVAWPPPGWDPRVLAAVRWAMVAELEAVVARCEEEIAAPGGSAPGDDAGP